MRAMAVQGPVLWMLVAAAITLVDTTMPETVVAQSAMKAQRPTHPLEGLKSLEYWAVYEVLQATGKVDADTFCISVLLHEPAKDKVLGWKAGETFAREADVILLRKGVTIEVRVDIAGRQVESWKERRDAQAAAFDTEFLGLGEEIKKDPQLQAALTAKGNPVEIQNAGVSGDTASDGLARLDWSVPQGTDAVILELGANDMLRGIDPDVTRRALETIMSELDNGGRCVRLIRFGKK